VADSPTANTLAVRLGNGWHPFALPPEALRQGIDDLRE
jgi:hypothetical protein